MHLSKLIRPASTVLALLICLHLLAPDARADTIRGCDFFNTRFVCSYEPLRYLIRMPRPYPSPDTVPVAVIYHDAGSSAEAIMANDALVSSLLDRGIAVLAPDAPLRENRRLDYFSDRPGMVEGAGKLIKAEYSKKRFYIRTPDGGRRVLNMSRDDGSTDDTGWYFYSTDRMEYSHVPERASPEFDYIGRDEVAALKGVLDHAAGTYGTDRTPSAVIGIGHGGSLVWQFACYNPDLTPLFVPIGGVFWQELPEDCRDGATILHTHERDSDFWPVEGRPGGKRRFTQTGLFETIEMILRAGGCNIGAKTGHEVGPVGRLTEWEDCYKARMKGETQSVGMLLLDGAFAFQDWWLDEVIGRIAVDAGPGKSSGEPGETEETEEPDTSPAPRPTFSQPGERKPFLRAGEGDQSRFKKPKYRQ